MRFKYYMCDMPAMCQACKRTNNAVYVRVWTPKRIQTGEYCSTPKRVLTTAHSEERTPQHTENEYVNAFKRSRPRIRGTAMLGRMGFAAQSGRTCQ
eukprot:364513-Chlamydomonas_euryale.AAC.11